MKKIIVCALLCFAATARAQTFDWEITPGLQTAWDIYDDRIMVSARSDDLKTFCDRNIVITQDDRQMEVTASKLLLDENTAFILFRPGYEACSTLYEGTLARLLINRFPGWFDPAKAFRILYKVGFDIQELDIPATERLEMEELPENPPGTAFCTRLRVSNILGFPTRNTMHLCVWLGTYSGFPAVYFSAAVRSGAVTIARDKVRLSQGENIADGLSFWGDNATTAALECPNCDQEISQGGAVTGAIYELPLWWDGSLPFRIYLNRDFIDVDNAVQPCAAEYVLGADAQALDAVRRFRDRTLARSAFGRMLIGLYYRHSERLIDLLERSPRLRLVLQSWLGSFVRAME